MNKKMENGFIKNITSYLKNTKENVVIIRSTHVKTGQSFDDNVFDANRAGFDLYRFQNTELKGFQECYKMVRR